MRTQAQTIWDKQVQVLSSKTPPELEDDDDAEYDLFDEQLK